MTREPGGFRAWGVALAVLLLAVPPAAWAGIPEFAAVKAAYVPSEAWLLDRHGEVLQSRRVDSRVRRLPWVRLDDFSPALRAALLASEDRRFYQHHGVDWRAFAGALWDNLRRAGSRPRGASTISMQVASLLDPALKPRGRDGRSLGQKWDQAMAARELERLWSKEQILEAYVNLTTWRGELQGIHAAARGLFDKHPSGLDSGQSLLLAALLRGPNASPETVAKRACALAATMDAGPPCTRLKVLAAERLTGPFVFAPETALAPHLAQRLTARPGERLATTLDAAVQRFAIETLRSHLAELAGRNVEDGAVIVLDNATGEVLAWVGSSGELSRAAQVDGVLAPRQAGSTLKPFLYELAIERRLLTAASLLDDAPLVLPTGGGLYIPQDYEKDFKGLVSVRTALASSLNIPAVTTLLVVGPERFLDRLKALGFDTLTERPDYYGYSLALGGAEITLAKLANAYRTLANGGLTSEPRVLPTATPAPAIRVMDGQAAWIVADILSDRGARALTFGLENPLATRSWSAVKTGTSKDMRDNWCVGFSDRYTVGVWVGNFSGQAMYDVSGISGAAPVWREIMDHLHRGSPSRQGPPPRALASRQVRFEPPLEAAREEWFLRGTEITVVSPAAPGPDQGRIAYPVPGAVLALDPDIPPGRQIVSFRSHPATGPFAWHLDGEALSSTDWRPTPGPHRLTLHAQGGGVLDEVAFEVRGTTAAVHGDHAD